MKTRIQTPRLTTRPILPDLIEVVRIFGEIHYTEATDLLMHNGVWGTGNLPSTPDATVNAYLTTSKDGAGRPIFTRTGRGVYALNGPVGV